MALQHGTTTAPGWINVLDAAEQWGKFPWEIMPRPGPLVWWLRYCAYRDVRIQVKKQEVEELRKNSVRKA